METDKEKVMAVLLRDYKPPPPPKPEKQEITDIEDIIEMKPSNKQTREYFAKVMKNIDTENNNFTY